MGKASFRKIYGKSPIEGLCCGYPPPPIELPEEDEEEVDKVDEPE